jgi:putative transposase
LKLQSEKQQKTMKAIYYEIKPSKAQSAVLSCLTYSASKLWNVANYERRNWDKESGE